MSRGREDDRVIINIPCDNTIAFSMLKDVITSDLNLAVVYNEPFRLKKAYAASLCSLFVASTAA